MGRKITPEQVAEALNPALSESTATLCGKKFAVITMPLSGEQVFLMKLRAMVPKTLNGPELIEALLTADAGKLCELAAMVASNAKEEMTADEILHSTRLVDIIGAIEVQIEKQGYLDFLLRIAAVLPGALTAKQ